MTSSWGDQSPSDPNQPVPQPPIGPPPGYPGPQGYGYPPAVYPGYTPPGYFQPPPHPQSVTAMVLGIVGLLCCGVASPFALWLGKKSMTEIDASGGQLGGRGQAQAGFIMGIIGSVFLAIALIAFGLPFVIGLGSTL